MARDLTGTKCRNSNSLTRDGQQARHLTTRRAASRGSLRDGHGPLLAGSTISLGESAQPLGTDERRKRALEMHLHYCIYAYPINSGY